ncbi:MAG: tRNA (adenosine(37)-N6)-dimethylallyltransferase MiaA, partial [Chloroflexota bacterium]
MEQDSQQGRGPFGAGAAMGPPEKCVHPIIEAMSGPNNHDESREAPQRSTLPPLVVMVGPTAVGKTAASLALAERIGAEIVNADSRYLYRGFDIGVAKPTAAERRKVPHHLIDVLEPEGDMSLARYQDLAVAAIEDVRARGNVPMLVGGTPLYVKAVVENWEIPRVPPDPAFRADLEAVAATEGIGVLEAQLRAVDPIAADRSAGNLRRVIRALEIHAKSGVPMSTAEGKRDPRYRVRANRLILPREELYARIDARVDDMISAGLVD